MAQASSRIVIHTSADAVWQVISDFGAASQYLAGVIDCTVDREGVGAQRVLTNIDGSTLVEQLETLNTAALQLSYVLLTDTPFGDCRTSIAVQDLGPSHAELDWSTSFQPVGIPTSEAVGLMEGALAENCLMLKQFMEAGGG